MNHHIGVRIESLYGFNTLMPADTSGIQAVVSHDKGFLDGTRIIRGEGILAAGLHQTQAGHKVHARSCPIGNLVQVGEAAKLGGVDGIPGAICCPCPSSSRRERG